MAVLLIQPIAKKYSCRFGLNSEQRQLKKHELYINFVPLPDSKLKKSVSAISVVRVRPGFYTQVLL